MKDHTICLEAINWAFVEATMAIGYVLSTASVSDDLTWSLIQQLDLIHEGACRRCRQQSCEVENPPEEQGHPAIIHLIELLRCRGIVIQVDDQSAPPPKDQIHTHGKSH